MILETINAIWRFLVRHPGAAMVLFGVAIEGLEIFLQWKFQHIPPRWEERIKVVGFAGWALVVFGLAVELIETRKSDREIASLNARSEELQLARVEAENEAAKLKIKIAEMRKEAEPRAIAGAEIQRVVREFPNTKFRLGWALDTDSRYVAGTFRGSILWGPVKWPIVGDAPNHAPRIGIEILHASPKMTGSAFEWERSTPSEEVAYALLKLLTDGGIAAKIEQWHGGMSGPELERDTIEINVFSKPGPTDNKIMLLRARHQYLRHSIWEHAGIKKDNSFDHEAVTKEMDAIDKEVLLLENEQNAKLGGRVIDLDPE